MTGKSFCGESTHDKSKRLPLFSNWKEITNLRRRERQKRWKKKNKNIGKKSKMVSGRPSNPIYYLGFDHSLDFGRCSATAVVFVQRHGKNSNITVRKLLAFADKDRSDTSLY